MSEKPNPSAGAELDVEAEGKVRVKFDTVHEGIGTVNHVRLQELITLCRLHSESGLMPWGEGGTFGNAGIAIPLESIPTELLPAELMARLEVMRDTSGIIVSPCLATGSGLSTKEQLTPDDFFIVLYGDFRGKTPVVGVIGPEDKLPTSEILAYILMFHTLDHLGQPNSVIAHGHSLPMLTNLVKLQRKFGLKTIPPSPAGYRELGRDCADAVRAQNSPSGIFVIENHGHMVWGPSSDEVNSLALAHHWYAQLETLAETGGGPGAIDKMVEAYGVFAEAQAAGRPRYYNRYGNRIRRPKKDPNWRRPSRRHLRYGGGRFSRMKKTYAELLEWVRSGGED